MNLSNRRIFSHGGANCRLLRRRSTLLDDCGSSIIARANFLSSLNGSKKFRVNGFDLGASKSLNSCLNLAFVDFLENVQRRI